MFVTTVVLHSLLRWLVIAFGLVAVYRAMSGVTGHRPWTPFDDRAGRLFVIALDMQTLVGLICTACSARSRARPWRTWAPR